MILSGGQANKREYLLFEIKRLEEATKDFLYRGGRRRDERRKGLTLQ